MRCGQPFNVQRRAKAESPDAPTMEHVTPQADGGSDLPGNLVANHRKCNYAKGWRKATGCERIWADVIGVKLYGWDTVF